MTALLEASGLAVAQGGVRVLEIPSLAVAEGQVLALVGPNGSGKTTLLKTLAGLLEPEAGELRFRGQALARDQQTYRRRVTMVFQAPLLFDTRVRANLEAGLRLHGVRGAERADRVQEAAERFGIPHLLERSARHLSGGEAQRVSLARAFALRPEALFLDEPFAALDPPGREALLEDLGRALRETRTTALIATHDQEEAVRLADRMAVLRAGRLVQEGPVQEVINAPADGFVADFVGMETVLEGVVAQAGPDGLRIAVGGLEVVAVGPAQIGETVRIGIRPENVTLAARADGPSSARNQFPARVLRVLPRGPFYKLELDCGFFLAAYVTAGSLQDLGLAPGTELLAAFKATAVHVMRRASEARGQAGWGE